MSTDLENVSNIFDPKNNNKTRLELKLEETVAKQEATINVLKQLAFQQQKVATVVDNLSEAVSALLYCLEKNSLTFDGFQAALPEVQANKMSVVLENMFKSNLAVQLETVETNSSCMVTGYVNGEKKTLRRSITVTDTENKDFLGKKVGDRAKASADDQEEFEILTIYRIGTPTNS